MNDMKNEHLCKVCHTELNCFNSKFYFVGVLHKEFQLYFYNHLNLNPWDRLCFNCVDNAHVEMVQG